MGSDLSDVPGATSTAPAPAAGAVTGFDARRLLALPPRRTVGRHDARDVMLYALGLGVGADDHDKNSAVSAATLKFAYEAQLSVLPTMAVVLAWPGFWFKEPAYGVDWQRVLHGEQSLEIHRTLPVEGEIVSLLHIETIIDKGADKGAVLYSRRELYAGDTGLHLATERRAAFLRGDGGKGGGGGMAPTPHALPQRAPDITVNIATRPDQALLYRLSGDRNPLHVDPAVAAGAGFSRPILHGLCTYGVAARALLQAVCDNDASRFQRMDCRFSTPVYPGETIATDIWLDDKGRASFRARAAERDVVILNNGFFSWRATPDAEQST